jgi:two-component system chemotaxis sensor kinase CheA
MDLTFDLESGDDRLFVDESNEQIEAIERGLLELEGGTSTTSTVNEVFRAAHTLKGSAATIGHRRMADLTHAMEDVFGALRSGTIADVAPFANTLLATVDVLRSLVEEVQAGHVLTDQPETLTAGLRTELAAVLVGPSSAEPAGPMNARGEAIADAADALNDAAPSPDRAGPSSSGAIRPTIVARLVAEAPTATGPRAIIHATVDPACEWSAVRLLQVILEVAEGGLLLASIPSQADVEAGLGDLEVTLLVDRDPASLGSLGERLRSIDDIVAVVLEPLAGATDGAPVEDVQNDDGEDRGADPRRMIDLGPEARGTTVPERVGLAADRLKAAQQTIRIDVGRLDELMNLVGELVVQKTRLQRQAGLLIGSLGADHPIARESEEGAQQFSRIVSQVQDQVTGLRMLPIETVFSRFPRVVRDVAARLGKEVVLVTEGKETELDRSVLEEVGDPLGHLVRNAMDHGIEMAEARELAGKPRRGQVSLTARHADGMIVITVEDDGAGMNPDTLRRKAVEKGLFSAADAAALTDNEALRIVFAPGFSTAAHITDVSGRGVGLDVVRTNVERLGGRVEIASTVGAGTKISLSLPLTLAIVGAMLVRSASRVCALPLAGVVETLRIAPSAVSWIRGRPVIIVRGRVIPIEILDAALGDPERPLASGSRGFLNIVVVRSRDSELGLAVDEFIGEQEIVLKSFSAFTGRHVGITGATILADGSVALVVDIGAILGRRSAGAAA